MTKTSIEKTEKRPKKKKMHLRINDLKNNSCHTCTRHSFLLIDYFVVIYEVSFRLKFFTQKKRKGELFASYFNLKNFIDVVNWHFRGKTVTTSVISRPWGWWQCHRNVSHFFRIKIFRSRTAIRICVLRLNFSLSKFCPWTDRE
jgi:hypothetical protein